MTFVLFTLLVPLLGLWARPRGLPFSAQLASCFGAGLVTLAIEMWAFSALGIRWSIPILVALPLLGTAGVLAGWSGAVPAPRPPRISAPNAIHAIPALAAIAVFASTVLSAAATSGDFFFFWGVKGQRFGMQRMLDLDFLRDPALHALHPDYPPLLPFYYAWTTLATNGALDWYAAMASPIFFLIATAMAVWGFTRSGVFTSVITSACALLYIRNDVAGNAEPALIFFEVLALAALTSSRSHDLIAALALGGAALTKVEGGAFVAIVVALAWLLREGTFRERLIAGAKVAAFPLFVFGAWLVYSRYHGLTATYVLPSSDASYATMTGATLREMSLRAWYTPWIAAIVLLVCGRARNAWPLIAASLAFVAFLIDVYVRTNGTPAWSAGRVLITPLVLLFFATVAAHRGTVTADNRTTA